MHAVQMIGRRFGKLVVIEYADTYKRLLRYKCMCDCGTECVVAGKHLRRGTTVSCKCVMRATQQTHGRSYSREYTSWQKMISRCTNPKDDAYQQWGGRGIVVCSQWLDSFEAFLGDMGCRPANTSIDRIDNDGPYSPENCRWATHAEQANNKRSTVWLTYMGQTCTQSEWSKLTGIGITTIIGRLRRGWSVDRALSTPPHRK